MSGWTPGPWKAWPLRHNERGMYRTINATNAESTARVAMAYAAGTDAWELNANARLIAAAPDLAEALRIIVDCGDWFDTALEIDPVPGRPMGKELEAMARAALARLDGGA